MLSRAVGRSPRSAEDPEEVVPCDRDHDAHRNHVCDLFFQNKISKLEAFNASVAVQASGAPRVADVAGADHYGRWKGNLARDVRRAFLKDVDKPNVYWARIPCKDLWSGQDSDVVRLLLVTRSARKSCGEARGGRELFRSNSTAVLKYEAQLLRQARHQGLGLLGDGVAHQRRTIVECFSWNVLGSHSAERYMFGLVVNDPWLVLGQLRFQH